MVFYLNVITYISPLRSSLQVIHGAAICKYSIHLEFVKKHLKRFNYAFDVIQVEFVCMTLGGGGMDEIEIIGNLTKEKPSIVI